MLTNTRFFVVDGEVESRVLQGLGQHGAHRLGLRLHGHKQAVDGIRVEVEVVAGLSLQLAGKLLETNVR